MMSTILLILLSLSGLALIIRGITYFLKLSNVKNWHPVEVVITRSEIAKIEKPEVYVKVEYFLPVIEYNYRISGVKYTSNVISIDRKELLVSDKKIIELFLETIRANKICYVNPKMHSESVLSIEVSEKRLSHYYGITMAGIALIILSIIFYIF